MIRLVFWGSVVLITGFSLLYHGYDKKKSYEIKERELKLEQKKIELEMRKLDQQKPNSIIDEE